MGQHKKKLPKVTWSAKTVVYLIHMVNVIIFITVRCVRVVLDIYLGTGLKKGKVFWLFHGRLFPRTNMADDEDMGDE